MKILKFTISCAVALLPLVVWSQLPTDSTKKHVDSLHKPTMDTVHGSIKVDTVRIIVDSIVKKDCYAEYYDVVRSRGAKAVTDGMQQVVIALKSVDGCHCFLGRVEVTAGKIKPPLFFQQENGEYRPVSAVGKRLEPAFTATMTPEELYTIKDGMSIIFRTVDQEYGRVFFYTFVNKGATSNKPAPSPTDLMKE
jgi:hypothetical protein